MNPRHTTCLVFALLASPALADWSQFRGPGGQGISMDNSLYCFGKKP